MILRKILSLPLYYSGFVDYFLNRYHHGLILGYHHILPEDDERISFLQPGMYVTTKTFELHIKFLSKYFKFININNLNYAYGNTDYCIITFDDGWSDNYDYAFPILKKYNIPATVFVATNYIGSNQWPWPDRLSFYIHRSSEDDISILNKLLMDLQSGGDPRLDHIDFTNKDRVELVENTISKLKQLSHNEIISFMEKVDILMKAYKNKLESYRPWLSWEEIKEMASSVITFGAHTHNHVILTGTTLKEAKEEIIESKDILSRLIGERIETFCYPNGFYHKEILEILSSLGFNNAVSTKSGSIDDSKSSLELRRIMVHDDISNSIPLFGALLIMDLMFNAI